MPPNNATVYRLALYDTEGSLVRVSEAYPYAGAPGPQACADACARAAAAGSGDCTAGTYAVWANAAVDPPTLAGRGLRPDAVRSFANSQQ